MITSLDLMNNVENEGVFHIDETHGIFKNKYRVVIFGISDQHGKLHPIAFMITSFETSYDFKLFYLILKELTQLLNLYLDSEFIMHDASDASYNDARAEFPDATVIICFFYFQQNVKIRIRIFVFNL